MDELLRQVRPGDIVLLHDPQTAGLAAPLARAGARVVWRCHIGVDWQNDTTRAAWDFLRPYLAAAHGFVFSRGSTCRRGFPGQAWIIPPSIDPFSAKNQQLDAATVQAILATIGVLDGEPPQPPGRFTRRDGTAGEVTRAGLVTADGMPGPADPVVVQVSRWDRLKDMSGVMRGFAEHVVPGGAGYLMLVGPMMSEVTDDPEGALVLAECQTQWRALPAAARARILLVTLPLDDVEENAAMVNAIQRHAQVIVQKSLAEGFGLTVAEGMWKGRPVIGSAVGGIMDQVADGTGVLLPDPADLAAFGSRCGSCSTTGRPPSAWAGQPRSTSARTTSATATCCNGHSSSAPSWPTSRPRLQRPGHERRPSGAVGAVQDQAGIASMAIPARLFRSSRVSRWPEPGLAVRMSAYGHAVAEGGYGRGDLEEAVVLGHSFAAGRGTGLEVAAAGADG